MDPYYLSKWAFLLSFSLVPRNYFFYPYASALLCSHMVFSPPNLAAFARAQVQPFIRIEKESAREPELARGGCMGEQMRAVSCIFERVKEIFMVNKSRCHTFLPSLS